MLTVAVSTTACASSSGSHTSTTLGGPPPPPGALLFDGAFGPATSRPRLVTNEYARANPHARDAIRSDDWVVTSGSLFERDGVAWSGRPDGVSPGPESHSHTDSAVFRMVTARRSFRDVAVTVRFRNLGLTRTKRTPARPWDGIHMFLRYVSPAELYYASVNRRDGTVTVKKKVRGGNDQIDGGTYTTLATGRRHVPYGEWQTAEAIVRDVGRDVVIDVYVDGRRVVHALDHGQGGRAPLTRPGGTGIRADNCEFEISSFTVTQA